MNTFPEFEDCFDIKKLLLISLFSCSDTWLLFTAKVTKGS